MGDLELPGGMRLAKPDPVAQQIVNGLAPILMSISNQIDLLIQLECGHLSHETMRKRFEAFEAGQLEQGQAGNGQVSG